MRERELYDLANVAFLEIQVRIHAVVIVILGAVASCTGTVKVTSLDSLEPIQTQFNADAGRPRLIALLSPT